MSTSFCLLIKRFSSGFLAGEFGYRTLVYRIAATGILFIALTLGIGDAIAHYHFERLREDEIAFLFRAIESGPLSFARLQSAELSGQALDRLMEGHPERELAVISVGIRGGAGLQYIYGAWTRPSGPARKGCTVEVDRDYSYPDSLHPWRVELDFDRCAFMEAFPGVRVVSVLSVLILVGVMIFVLGLLFKPVLHSLKTAEALLRTGASGGESVRIPFIPIRELGELAIRQFKREKELAQVEVARQVAHDIRSPLAALEMVSGQSGGIPGESRLILKNAITRIRDIANLLCSRSPADTGEPEPQEGPRGAGPSLPVGSMLIHPVLDSLLSEKRFEFRQRAGVVFNHEEDPAFSGLSVAVDPVGFKRVISNLVNNSVESFHEWNGQVELRVAGDDVRVEIEVRDSGRGIPPGILERIGHRGVTFGKPGGSGFGLAHAKEFVEASGGTLGIRSTPGAGTQVRITLPRVAPPDWFLPELHLSSGSTVIIVDDEEVLHQLWRRRIREAGGATAPVEVKSFRTFDQLRAFYRSGYLDLEDPRFLMDYEVLTEPGQNGLRLISELGIEKRSCLVTSHDQDPAVIAGCVGLGVKMIPKSMSGSVPVLIV